MTDEACHHTILTLFPRHTILFRVPSFPPLLYSLNFVGIKVGGRGKGTDYAVRRSVRSTAAYCGAHETAKGRHPIRSQCIMCHPLTKSKKWIKTFDVQAFLPGAATAGM